MKCDWKHNGYDYCLCFSTISNNGMKPKSGIYNIKIKINNIDKYGSPWNNIIGITSEKYDNNHRELKNKKYYDWTTQ